MLVDMIFVGMVQVPIVKVVNVSFVLYSGVPAPGTVFVRVLFVNTT
jgi:hypothetical protein